MKQKELFSEINNMQENVTKLQEQYWFEYTNIDSWQFWVMVLMFIIPLILLFFYLSKKNTFLILFYGLNIHVWFAYIDSFGVRRGLWEYPHSLTPYFPFSLALDGALVPVAFLFVYQLTYTDLKKFYLYSTGLSLIFAFVLKPILSSVDLFAVKEGFNYFHLFLLYCLIFVTSKFITSTFIWYQNRAQSQPTVH